MHRKNPCNFEHLTRQQFFTEDLAQVLRWKAIVRRLLLELQNQGRNNELVDARPDLDFGGLGVAGHSVRGWRDRVEPRLIQLARP